MKKSNLQLLAIASLTALLGACTNKELEPTINDSAKEAHPTNITLNIPAEGITKADLDSDSATKTSWEETDIIIIKDAYDESRSATFSYSSGKGNSTATFSTADVSALEESTKYNIYLNSGKIADLTEQTQTAIGSTDHLVYAATLEGVDKFDGAVFSEAWAKASGGRMVSSSTLTIQAELPNHSIANAVQKVIIKASSKIFGGSKTLTINISNPGVPGNGKTITVSATLPAGETVIPAGTEIIYQFQVSTNATNKYTAYRKKDAAMTIPAGELHTVTLDCKKINKSAGLDDDGSEAHPYLVGDRRQMQAMSGLLAAGSAKYFKLVDDIDVHVIDWTPLNPDPCTKKVFLNGNGKTITKLNAPLFDDLNGKVYDLRLDQSTVSGDAAIGALAKTLKTANSTVQGVKVTNSSVTTTGGYAGGLIGHIEKAFTIMDCSVENTTVEGNDHYAGGLVASMSGGTIKRCHTTGTVTIEGSKRHAGGIVGIVEPGGTTSITLCWSSCNVHAWGFAGGIAGTIQNTSRVTLDRCFASGTITAGNIAGAGGLVGQVYTSNVHITNSVAWNGVITPAKYALGNYSSGAVVGRAHPNCVLTNNYRKPGMQLTAYWVPSKKYDHPNVNGTSAPLVRIDSDKVEANAKPTNLTTFDSDHGRWAYHGKHCSSGTSVYSDDAFGWTGDIVSSNATWKTTVLREGVVWTQIHDNWEGQMRNINIVKTTLSSQNRIAMYYDYGNGQDLRDKCDIVEPLIATNGPMACCHYVRIDGVTKRVANDQPYYITEGAITIDDNVFDIVRTTTNYDAAALPNQNIGCAGPMLVYDGVIQEFDMNEEFIATTHPRTAIGVTEDGGTVIQVTVDGRWTSSDPKKQAVGMEAPVLARLMKSLGCYKAINLDGGGGTAMWIDGYGVDGIVNHPCEKPMNWDNPTLRTVGTAIYIK
ncbi:MAG: phosphodiester glycosidase family protein [Bacteroidales bacterium]|nr:phosphodiester glycosidase family protein [Bacteroidales bacterium]